MSELHFDFRDVFRAGRYGLSGKKLSIHFFGVALAYLIYEGLVYLSLLLVGGNAAGEFWNRYALLPVCPSVDYDLEAVTAGAMWLGLFVFFIIFFSTSTMVSKIAIQQLRGDSFFSIKDSAVFFKMHWKAVFGPFVGLIVVFFLCMIVPNIVGLLGKIPWVGKIILMFSSLLIPLVFFLGLLIVYLLLILNVSLFFIPAVVAAAEADTFETIYQHFSIVWNQPWRIVVYEVLLFGLKLICVPIWAIFCLLGFSMVMLPVRHLLPTDMMYFMGNANAWLGQLVQKVAALPFLDGVAVFDTIAPSGGFSGFETLFMKLTSIFVTLSLLFIIGLIIAYLFSIASVGNTIIYTILRRRVDGENLLEVVAEGETFPDQNTPQQGEVEAVPPEN